MVAYKLTGVPFGVQCSKHLARCAAGKLLRARMAPAALYLYSKNAEMLAIVQRTIICVTMNFDRYQFSPGNLFILFCEISFYFLNK